MYFTHDFADILLCGAHFESPVPKSDRCLWYDGGISTTMVSIVSVDSSSVVYRFGVRRLRVREIASFHTSIQLLAVASSACTSTKFGRYVVSLNDILLTLLSNVRICIIKYIVWFVNINTKVF